MSELFLNKFYGGNCHKGCNKGSFPFQMLYLCFSLQLPLSVINKAYFMVVKSKAHLCGLQKMRAFSETEQCLHITLVCLIIDPLHFSQNVPGSPY